MSSPLVQKTSPLKFRQPVSWLRDPAGAESGVSPPKLASPPGSVPDHFILRSNQSQPQAFCMYIRCGDTKSPLHPSLGKLGQFDYNENHSRVVINAQHRIDCIA